MCTINDISAPTTGTYTLNIYGVDGDGIESSGRDFTDPSTAPRRRRLISSAPAGAQPRPSKPYRCSSTRAATTPSSSETRATAPDLDYITISPNTQVAGPPCTSAICTYYADSPSNTLWGSTHNGNYQVAQIVNCSGCVSGFNASNFDNGYAGVIMNNIYAPIAGTYNLTIYGVDGDGSGNYRVMSISVNGGTAQSANISGNSWSADAIPVTIPVQLTQGNNSVNFSSFLYDYGPGLDYVVVSPQPQLTPIGSGPVQINYDLNTGLASFVYDGSTIISNFYSQVMLGGAAINSTSGSYTRQITNGSNGETDVTLTASDGTPTMVQRFILVNNNYLLMQVELEGENGATLSSNQMSPIVTSMPKSITLPTVSDPRFLLVPFDNDSFSTYNDASVYNSLYNASSYEVGVFHDGGTRNALVVGSVTHDTWKTGIIVNSAYGNYALDTLNVVGGFAAPEDQVPHGSVTGNTIASPTIMVGFYSDWRDGLEAHANANAQVAPMLAWTKPAPMGWSSWVKFNRAWWLAPRSRTPATSTRTCPNSTTRANNTSTSMPTPAGPTPQSQQFNATAQAQGQTVGNYWTPWIWWNSDNPLTPSDLSSLVEGSTYTYGDIVMRDPYGNPLRLWDGGYALDPTHPGTLQRLDFYYLKFSTNGFEGIKLDFLSHGIVEGGSNNGQHYLSTIQTGVQAYNYGMAYLAKKFGATMYMDESISPIFPYEYAHARRVSCDTFGQIGSPRHPVNSSGTSTSYEMNSAGYGWWLAGRLYNFNDPDQIVMEGFTSYENKSRSPRQRSRATCWMGMTSPIRWLLG